MLYASTRGQAPELPFDEVALAGLASDGGLYLPKEIPHFSVEKIESLRGLSYADLAYEVIAPFVAGTVPEADLREMLNESYASFRHGAIAPLKQLGHNDFLLELFHGPTLAFKDFALQFLGRLLDYLLEQRGMRASVLGATSGDTGSAAIAGFMGRGNMEIFILYPDGRVSDVQRRQMTTISESNVHCLALDGAFDDCQNIVKALFGNAEFRERQRLVAVNSINWARILAQVVYYFYAGIALGAPHRAASYCVPTGNFGDIYAGYIAKQMGLPIEQLVIATNQNDILTRCVESGTYGMNGVVPTITPSMDIQISSNFERLLFNLHGGNGDQLRGLMEEFKQHQSITLAPDVHAKLKAEFSAASVHDDATKAAIARVYKETGELLDPHTAVGIAAKDQLGLSKDTPMVTLATAHPAKFPAAVKAASGMHPELPPHLADLFELEERFTEIPNSMEAVMQRMDQQLGQSGQG